MVHDVFYEHGFTEPAGNFQQNNFNKGGIGGDLIIINIQKSDKENTASFHTPPDGQYGVLNLHIFTNTKPNRDSALDNTILTHELTHGLSSRLTGGALEIMCMSETEPLGLSEGYSDMMALIFTAKPEDTRNTEKVISEYVKGNSRGMRMYTYTTDMKVNPLNIKTLLERSTDTAWKQGNIMFLQLFVGTLMLQPCNPTFYSAYDAMLAADYAYYGGIHEHLIIKGFTKRGLGSIL
ncbi:hypothetical protein BASA61_004240 [Batrachochytrium salamandrivorans]|nr:hypothetical protein BASA61_004240 [Batrachochytrium salamandrivorans]